MGAVKVGAVIAGKYQLEARFAEGGMGAVWSARHLSLDTRVAIKFIGPEVAELDEARTRFEREAKIAALLQSPHVVQIHDYGVDGELPYLVMELLEGEDLGARLAARGRLTTVEAVSIVAQVARALRRAAQARIVHRDLKPGNVFLVRGDDDDEIAKVLDFGIAKAPWCTQEDATRSGAMIGSPRYMSPEQVRGSKVVDHRADLWSLAVIAYRALTGQLPFQGADVPELLIAICQGTFEPPSRVEPSLGPDVDAFFERALACDPDRRFQAARDLSRAFAAACGEASPPSVSLPAIPVAALVAAAAPSPLERTRPSFGPLMTLPILDVEAAPEPPMVRAPAPTPREWALSQASIGGAPEPRPAPPRAALVHPIVGALLVIAILVGLLVGRATSRSAPVAPTEVSRIAPSAQPLAAPPPAAPPPAAPPAVPSAEAPAAPSAHVATAAPSAAVVDAPGAGDAPAAVDAPVSAPRRAPARSTPGARDAVPRRKHVPLGL